jgi:hypothetical protein
MRENLQLFQAAVPVMLADNSSRGSSSSSFVDDSEEQQQSSGFWPFVQQKQQYTSRFVAHCSSPVDRNTLQPVAMAFCTVSERDYVPEIGVCGGSNVAGAFQVQRSISRLTKQQHQGHATTLPQQEPVLGVGPLQDSVQQLGAWLGQYVPRAVVRGLAMLWHFTVPTGSMAALQPLLQQLQVLQLEFEWQVLVVYIIGERGSGC